MEGWIKLHRKFLDWGWFDRSEMVHLFVYLLLSVNTEDKDWHGIQVQRGQLVTSVASLSEATHLSTRQIRTCLGRLQETKEIIVKSTNRFTIVTVCNYGSYQISEDEANKQLTNKQQTTNKQLTTSKEYKNIISTNVDNEESSDTDDPRVPQIDIKKFMEFFNFTLDKSRSLIPRLGSIGDTRRLMIRARIREHGKESLMTVTKKAAVSDFLNGKNDRAWVANFDWLIRPTNYTKVLEGNYDNTAVGNAGKTPQLPIGMILTDNNPDKYDETW